MASAFIVAHAIAAQRREPTPAELHRLLYLCQGFALAWRGKPLFDEPIEARKEGPVVASLSPSQGTNGTALRDDDREILVAVLSYFAGRNGAWLTALAQRQQPWRDSRGNVAPQTETKTPISPDSMRSYFHRLAPTPADLSPALMRGLDLMVRTPLDEIDDLLCEEEQANEELERWLTGSTVLDSLFGSPHTNPA